MLTSEQRRAVEAEGSVAVTAGAGSGKTFLLTERYLHLVGARGLSPLEIVATTFTRKAAAELKSRIRKRLQSAHLDAETVAELEAASIGTFDALAARVCRDFPLEAGLPADFRVMDEDEEKLFRARYLDEAMAKVPEGCFEELPYSTLKRYVEQLLFDPIAAEAALHQDTEAWAVLAERTREEAREALLADLAGHKHTLKALQGPAGDAREATRLEALRCINQIETGDAATCEAAYEAAQGLVLRGGSKKVWGEEAFKAVGIAVSALRDGVRRNLKKLTLKLGDADALLAELLPAVRTAFACVRAYLTERRFKDRVVDFASLEVHALEALEHAHVTAHYRARWRAFLVDELQDTNRVQERFLNLLTEGATLTVVGDAKQSVYGFRRADVDVFFRFREAIQEGGEVVALDTSLRTHAALLAGLNELTRFLGDLHEPLRAFREDVPGGGPHLEAYCLEDPAPLREAGLEQEARLIAARVAAFLSKRTPVHDGSVERPAEPRDIAVIAATKAPLGVYAEALLEAGVPAVLTEADDLLGTREAQDGLALLRFLADPRDDLALVTLLRSPFFALSDITLQRLAQAKGERSWWAFLEALDKIEDDTALGQAKATLTELADKRKRLPTELFDLAEKRTAYPAVIANLVGGARRLADYRAFTELVRRLEADTHNAFSVWRDIRDLITRGVNVARPPVEVGNAVTLINAHKAKGLEWPIVIAADLGRRFVAKTEPMYFSGDVGVALKLDRQTPSKTNPVIFEALEQQKGQRESAEAKRLLYVTLTRAKDYLVLTTAAAPEDGTNCAYNLLNHTFIPLLEARLKRQ